MKEGKQSKGWKAENVSEDGVQGPKEGAIGAYENDVNMSGEMIVKVRWGWVDGRIWIRMQRERSRRAWGADAGR